MRYHLIAIGGAVMHNLALALHDNGFRVSGSDDEIFDPAKSRLLSAGLLPEKYGWYPERITREIDFIILGMHAKADNPELVKARELGLKILSFPEFLFEKTKDKMRVVIGGSHGKTSITSMIMHVLHWAEIEFDYMVGAQIAGFDRMVRFSPNAQIAVFEGDEYLSSALDSRPKFHLYKPHIAVLSGIAWDHINVFPSFDNYVDQFKIFSDLIQPGGKLIYFRSDEHLEGIIAGVRTDIQTIGYETHPFENEAGISYLLRDKERVPLCVFGDHNLQNIQAAKEVCMLLGINEDLFYNAISKFRGAAKRLQQLASNESASVFLDFAHSPSKLKATVQAVKKQFPSRKLIACMELHTYSSLTKQFLCEYRQAMSDADLALVYFDQSVLALKRLPAISKEEVREAFGGNIMVMNQPQEIRAFLESLSLEKDNLLLMSSGNFSGINFTDLAKKLIPS